VEGKVGSWKGIGKGEERGREGKSGPTLIKGCKIMINICYFFQFFSVCLFVE